MFCGITIDSNLSRNCPARWLWCPVQLWLVAIRIYWPSYWPRNWGDAQGRYPQESGDPNSAHWGNPTWRLNKQWNVTISRWFVELQPTYLDFPLPGLFTAGSVAQQDWGWRRFTAPINHPQYHQRWSGFHPTKIGGLWLWVDHFTLPPLKKHFFLQPPPSIGDFLAMT